MRKIKISLFVLILSWVLFPWLQSFSFVNYSWSKKSTTGVSEERKSRAQLKFIRCHDGDTCVASTQEGILMTLRLYGVDAPEEAKTRGPMRIRREGQAFGNESHIFIEQQVQDKKLWVDIMGSDVYNRYLAIIYPQDIDPNKMTSQSLNQILIEEGYAFAYRALSKKVPPSPDWAFEAELKAQKNKKGFWALEKPPENPSEFRKKLKRKN